MASVGLLDMPAASPQYSLERYLSQGFYQSPWVDKLKAMAGNAPGNYGPDK